jgi:ribonuclease R
MESSNLQHVLRTVKGKPEEKFINILVLRALKLAVYSPENQGHFGLAKKEYTHFTSPIRRYPDLVVHRILKRALAEEKPLKLPLDTIGLQASHQERNAEEAEKELVEWRIFRLLREKLGEELEGIVVAVSRAGLVVELDEYFVDGLLPSGDLDRIPAYRRSKRALRGRKTAKKIGLGDRIRVIIAAVDPFQRRMTLALGSSQEERGQ